jgi:hypothetical protein
MDVALLRRFQNAIQARHGARSLLLRRERVLERSQGGRAGGLEVLVFAVEGHPTARRCYAWAVGGELEIALHEPPLDSPAAAVRAASMGILRERDWT